jgi:hypothetical protein
MLAHSSEDPALFCGTSTCVRAASVGSMHTPRDPTSCTSFIRPSNNRSADQPQPRLVHLSLDASAHGTFVPLDALDGDATSVGQLEVRRSSNNVQLGCRSLGGARDGALSVSSSLPLKSSIRPASLRHISDQWIDAGTYLLGALGRRPGRCLTSIRLEHGRQVRTAIERHRLGSGAVFGVRRVRQLCISYTSTYKEDVRVGGM